MATTGKRSHCEISEKELEEQPKKIARRDVNMNKKTITITFGDQAENHVGMEKLGSGLAKEGFKVTELEVIKENLETQYPNATCELVQLNDSLPEDITGDEAAVLVIRGGVTLFSDDKFTLDEIKNELGSLKWDSKAKMYGRVVQKHARHNLCFADYSQDPDYENGKGTVVNYTDLPCLAQLRAKIAELGEKSKNLYAEGNLYFDTGKCGIGYHGDAERKIVVAFRLGTHMPLHYQWYHEGKPIGNKVELLLASGDLYIMSEKATGFDWKKKKIPTLRHAAGCPKYTNVPVPKTRKKVTTK